ncbi:CCA tRNA nucleotidyltransferase 1, mitochondrial [Schistocerca piceifrons]|uniref:CCA tRNA nucleotidyltransferase 1, mitochondrial n=1 Tax=Schistocerca piceifrons TaxID=274613 RepID=UPI001F5E6670|nr:CCA tRNA nucleotidyltransferase 1, mitochondrial [Schistocerca piceifrons]
MFVNTVQLLSRAGRLSLANYVIQGTVLQRLLYCSQYTIIKSSASTMAGERSETFKIDTPEFHALFTPEVDALSALFKKYGYELRIAGGAVRDLLMKINPKDLDFATTATPDQMKEMFETEGVRMINMKGEKHGTVTPRINDKENFEVTTLRIDVRTDGRHADVEFTTDWKLDANRRDLTINSMFLGLDGTVYDYFDGYNDLLKRRVVFVGNPNIRIQEDYLRILRYFRFYGRIAEHPDKHEEKTLEAIRINAEGLARISGERIWSELHKILEGNYGGDLMLKILSLGIGPYIGLPSDPNIEELQAVWKRRGSEGFKAMTLLTSLLRSQEQVMNFHGRVKLSAYDRDLGLFIVENREDKISVNPLRPYQALVINSKYKAPDCRDYAREVLKYRGDHQLLAEFDSWELPRFPLNGNMLREKGVPGGKITGLVMKQLKEIWIESDFNMSPEDLLAQIPAIANTLGIDIKR